MYWIHVFWFVAFAVADRIATLPEPPVCSDTISSIVSATCLDSTWLMNRSRQSAEASESKVMTLLPAPLASFSAGHTASGSFAASTMTLVPAWTSELMNETCEEDDASSGPTTCASAKPSSAAASLPPPSMTSEKGLLSCLGMKVIVLEETS